MTINRRRFLYVVVLTGILIAGIISVTYLLRKPEPVAYSVYRVEQGWGYDIEIEGQVKIHQPFIPAIEGMRPFPDKASAREVARFVIRKLGNGEYPALTKAEVDSLLARQ